jgi:hypothetical protein
MPLLATFSGLDRSLRESLADIKSPLLLAFAAMLIARDRCDVADMSAEHIVAALEAAGIAVPRASVQKALGRAGNRVAKHASKDGDTLFRLMLPGEREVAHLLDRAAVEVFRFDGSTPRKARQQLGSLLAKLTGHIRICDPYLGLRTLDNLDHLPAKTLVRFLTAKISDSAAKMTVALKDFRTEHPGIAFRQVPLGTGLHDRYILTDDSLLLVGHGLKDVGAKESFLVALEKVWAPDLLADTAAAFDSRWSAATPI